MEMIAVQNNNSRFPFTSNQWQELEHQALVYKYIISGMPIPPHLLFSIKTSLNPSTKLILHHNSPHHSFRWDYFHLGSGRKIDPEPGRCRRTDGKKWRCSKEAFPDSKYCERHMHRGRNRSRKPVESNLLTLKTKSPKYPSPFHPQFSSSRSLDNVVSSQDSFLMESSPYSHSEKDHSYRIKEDADKSFLSERIGRSNISGNNSSSLAPSKQQSFSDYQNEYSYPQLQNTPTRQKQDQGRFNDQLALKIEGKDEARKLMHHFFDELPGCDNDDHNKDKDSSATQLSISVPSCGHDFFLTRNDK